MIVLIAFNSFSFVELLVEDLERKVAFASFVLILRSACGCLLYIYTVRCGLSVIQIQKIQREGAESPTLLHPE